MARVQMICVISFILLISNTVFGITYVQTENTQKYLLRWGDTVYTTHGWIHIHSIYLRGEEIIATIETNDGELELKIPGCEGEYKLETDGKIPKSPEEVRYIEFKEPRKVCTESNVCVAITRVHLGNNIKKVPEYEQVYVVNSAFFKISVPEEANTFTGNKRSPEQEDITVLVVLGLVVVVTSAAIVSMVKRKHR